MGRVFRFENVLNFVCKRIENRTDESIEIMIISEAWTGLLAPYPGALSMKTLENCGQLRRVFPFGKFWNFCLENELKNILMTASKGRLFHKFSRVIELNIQVRGPKKRLTPAHISRGCFLRKISQFLSLRKLFKNAPMTRSFFIWWSYKLGGTNELNIQKPNKGEVLELRTVKEGFASLYMASFVLKN